MLKKNMLLSYAPAADASLGREHSVAWAAPHGGAPGLGGHLPALGQGALQQPWGPILLVCAWAGKPRARLARLRVTLTLGLQAPVLQAAILTRANTSRVEPNSRADGKGKALKC